MTIEIIVLFLKLLDNIKKKKDKNLINKTLTDKTNYNRALYCKLSVRVLFIYPQT